MIARGFRPVGWVAALGVAALGCYMLSLRVASERADLASLDRRIVAVQRNIRSLQTEVGTRSRIPQLEEWNNDVLALAAPASGQFLGGNISLARFDMRAPELPDQAEIRLASADAPAPAPPQAAPALAPQRTAPVPPALPAAQRAVAAAAPAPRPELRRASLAVAAGEAPAPVKPRAVPAPAQTRTAAGEERARPAAAPVRTASTQQQRARPAPARTAARAAAAPVRGISAPPPRVRPAAAPVRQARGAAARPLLGDRTLRDLGHASLGEREQGKRD